MAKLQIATDRWVPPYFFYKCQTETDPTCTLLFFRSSAGVLVSDVKGRDIKIDSFTMSFHGRLLIEGAEISLNYGQRYGLLGENGSGKVRQADDSDVHIHPNGNDIVNVPSSDRRTGH
jgi:hypothetical protein